LQRDIDALASIDVHANVGGEFGKAVVLGGDLVLADRYVQKVVVSLIIGGGFLLNTGALIAERHRCVGYQSAGGVANGSQDFGRFGLSVRRASGDTNYKREDSESKQG
jgi:hypothetical protein